MLDWFQDSLVLDCSEPEGVKIDCSAPCWRDKKARTWRKLESLSRDRQPSRLTLWVSELENSVLWWNGPKWLTSLDGPETLSDICCLDAQFVRSLKGNRIRFQKSHPCLATKWRRRLHFRKLVWIILDPFLWSLPVRKNARSGFVCLLFVPGGRSTSRLYPIWLQRHLRGALEDLQFVVQGLL